MSALQSLRNIFNAWKIWHAGWDAHVAFLDKKQAMEQVQPSVVHAASPQPVPQPPIAPVLAPQLPGDRLKEYLKAHPMPSTALKPAHLTPEQKRNIFADMGTAPKLNKDDVPIKRNPLARSAANDWIYQPMPTTKPDESWINSAPVRSRLLELEDLATPAAVDDDDDNAPTAYGRAIMLDKVARKAHEQQEAS